MAATGRILIVVLGAGLLVACDGPATAPTPAAPSLRRLEVIGLSRLAPGATTQLRLVRVFSDGTTEDITSNGTFFANAGDILDVTRTGLVTALKLGEDFVWGQTETLASEGVEIVVVPDGTFRVVGQVVEADASGLPVGGVRVEVDGLPPAVTDFDGLYRLYGVPGRAGLRVSKAGYSTRDIDLALSNHHTENVALSVAGPRVDLAGAYQLTVEAGSDCAGSIPETLLVRRFAVGITQIGSELRMALAGPNILPPGRGRPIVPGQVDRQGISLELASPTHCDFSEPDARIIEVVDVGTILEISGSARMSPLGSGFEGTLTGDFVVRSESRCGAAARTWCSSRSHRVRLTR